MNEVLVHALMELLGPIILEICERFCGSQYCVECKTALQLFFMNFQPASVTLHGKDLQRYSYIVSRNF